MAKYMVGSGILGVYDGEFDEMALPFTCNPQQINSFGHILKRNPVLALLQADAPYLLPAYAENLRRADVIGQQPDG